MASSIDTGVPASGAATTASVRTNFTAAKNEIEALQTDKANLASPTFTGTVTNTAAVVNNSTTALNGVVTIDNDIAVNWKDALDATQATAIYSDSLEFFYIGQASYKSGITAYDTGQFVAGSIESGQTATLAAVGANVILQTTTSGDVYLNAAGDIDCVSNTVKNVAGLTGTYTIATANIADDAVTNAKIGALAVGTTEIAADAVTNAKIATGAVDTTELAADAVTYDKMQNVVANDVFLGNNAGAGGVVAELDATAALAILGVEAGATADQSDAEIETAYNNQVAQASGAELTAGTATAIRRYAPADLKSLVNQHDADSVDGYDVWVGSDAAYTAISPKDANTIYFTTG